MFDEALARVEESFRGLGQVRQEVGARAERAGEEELTRMLQVTERLRRAADALEMSLMGHAARFGEEIGPDHVYRPVRLRPGEVAEFAVEAVGVALHSSPHEAGRRCDLAARAITDLAPLADLLAEGRIRTRALEVVAKETREASPEAVAAIIDHLLDPLRGRPGTTRIGELDDRELRKAIRRMLQRVEPELLQAKAERNRKHHLDVGFSAASVGTSDLYATLPTEFAAVLKEAVEQAAARRRRDDPEITAGASRAYGLLDLALRGVEVTANVRLGIPVITSAASRLSFAPFAGGDSAPPAGDAAQALHGPTAREGRLVTGDGPDAVDVLAEEWAGDAITSQVPTTLGPGGQESWISGCDVPGVGFVPADVVAALTTHLDTRVSRALIDARTGVLVETSTPRYVVPDAMREFVAARDETCRMWGCNRAIWGGCTTHGADLDHAVPYPAGPSCPSNLAGLCRHHHLLKHSPRWGYELLPDGRTRWTGPGGAEVTTFPATWVHTDDEGGESSPPPEGAKGEAADLTPAEMRRLLFHPNLHGPIPF